MPSGTAEQPLVLRTDDGDGPSSGPDLGPYQQLRPQPRGGGTPGRSSNTRRVSGPPGASPARTPGARGAQPSPSARQTQAAVLPYGSPRRSGTVTPRPRHAAAAWQPAGPAYQTPGAASPLRGARTPLGIAAAPASPAQGRLPRRLVQLQLELPKQPDAELLKHPKGQGTFFFTPAAAQHLPMLMAGHLTSRLQRLLRSFNLAAQCVITARAMALYASTSDAEYFRDQRLEAALMETRSRQPPQDRYCAYSQTVRLTGRKRKPAASPHPAGGGGSNTPAAATRGTPGQASCADVDMDSCGCAFAGGGTLHCPGGVASKKAGRHENWLLSDAADSRVTYLPVMYDSEEHSAVLLPLADPRVGAEASLDAPLVWFRYEYESRGGRRGRNFWDHGLATHLEQAVRDVAGEEALRAALGD